MSAHNIGYDKSSPNAEYVRVIGGPWPERIGCVARIIDPATQPGHYPWVGLGKGEVVIKINDDPLGTSGVWSCVILRRDLSPIASSGMP